MELEHPADSQPSPAERQSASFAHRSRSAAPNMSGLRAFLSFFFFFLSAAKLTNYSIDFTFDQKSGPLNEQGGDCATAIAADVGVSFNLFGGASEVDLRGWTWRTLTECRKANAAH